MIPANIAALPDDHPVRQFAEWVEHHNRRARVEFARAQARGESWANRSSAEQGRDEQGERLGEQARDDD